MGDVTRMREDARSVWVRPWLESAMQDVTYALRGEDVGRDPHDTPSCRTQWFRQRVTRLPAVRAES